MELFTNLLLQRFLYPQNELSETVAHDDPEESQEVNEYRHLNSPYDVPYII